MKKIACLFVMSILVLISSSAYADDGNFTCGSDIAGFSGKTFENLSADFRKCQTSPVFDGLTVKDTMVITGNASVRFTNSSINRLSLECSGKEGCEIGLEEGTSIEVLELYPENNNQITINGIAGDKSLPAYYNVGYLCEGQPEFSLYADAKSEIDFRIKDLDAFPDMAFIEETIIHAKVGNHELGHVLESTLNTDVDDQLKGVASNDILQSVLPKVMTPAEQSQVNYNQADGKNAYDKNIYQGQIDTTSPIFTTKRMSSSYGQSMPKEWFAEAFHDVYTKGADAKPTSIEIVKEYEKRQTEKQKSSFAKKEAGIFTRIGRWFSRKFNFGRNHGDPEPVQQNANVPAPQNGNDQAAANVPQQIAVNNLLEDEDMIVHAPKRRKIKRKKK